MSSDKYPKYEYFAFWPAKALAGSRHLSDKSFKAYWMILWWMWMHGEDQCTMPDKVVNWEMATGLKSEEIKKVRREIMAPGFPLLKKEGGLLKSLGLQKSVLRLRLQSDKQREKVNKRWSRSYEEHPSDTAVIPQQYQCNTNKIELELKYNKSPSGATPEEAYGFSTLELQYLKAMPGLKNLVDKSDVETIKSVIKGVQVLKLKWPQVFAFVNKALNEKVPLLTISGAIQACLKKPKPPEDWRSYFQACIHRHGRSISEQEWERLWPEIKSGRGSLHGVGAILERLGL